jgi:outer membrane protein assembly factor BamA
MRILSRALLTLLLLAPLPTLAQTYTPKTIRVDAPSTVDTAEALRIAALPTSAPLTKQQIEAALQRLADTGLFSDVAYTVNADALVIKLTPSASSQLQPVHFGNLVWWRPAELESLLEASVPAYHGQLPLAGTLTDQVRAALVSLLHTKGVDATVDAHQNGLAADSVSLSIVSPSILIDNAQFQSSVPALLPQLKTLQHRLHGEDFDIAETTRTVQESVNDIYENAGYLAVDTSAPTYSAPHKDLLNYAVDLTSTITPGEIYHISGLSLHAQPPVSQAELEKAANLKPGDVASPAAQRLARAEMQRVYESYGYLDAKVLFTLHEDNEAHTVEYACNFVPGELYHFASIDTSALTPQQQQSIAHDFHPTPGAVFDHQLTASLGNAFLQLHLARLPRVQQKLDPANHTVTLILQPAPSSLLN